MTADLITDAPRLRTILEQARTIAVLGASTQPSRAGFYVPNYLREQGYRIIPVNPLHHRLREWGEPFRRALAEIAEPVDIVDVFRHPGFLPGHLDDILAMQPRPATVWLQSGIRHDEFANQLIAAGICVVQDRCTLADHRAFGLGPRRT
ncbi:CoA-binding protein [Pseudenhygromyxa sp. WMMC2535]|uniref:CoA-binding protein n=1 Tax=Pseudenhygromyxa sp. WMMC2535 TaxID=2712867 RepID=UPI0015547397|nr:CoA-binding protein [Pseudenhygromyxa sp. WMMC2535]NVB42272.1 CoA-binding protein [Pseudenhygromyxa sp. WMMC2535]